MVHDPRDVSVKVGDYEIPHVNDIDPTFGETVSPVSSNQGVVGHQVKIEASVCKIKFMAGENSDVLTGLNAYHRAKTEFTATIVCPDYSATFTGAMLHGYPKRAPGTADSPEYEIEFSGKSDGPHA